MARNLNSWAKQAEQISSASVFCSAKTLYISGVCDLFRGKAKLGCLTVLYNCVRENTPNCPSNPASPTRPPSPLKVAIVAAGVEYWPLAQAANTKLPPEHQMSERTISLLATDKKLPTLEQAVALSHASCTGPFTPYFRSCHERVTSHYSRQVAERTQNPPAPRSVRNHHLATEKRTACSKGFPCSARSTSQSNRSNASRTAPWPESSPVLHGARQHGQPKHDNEKDPLNPSQRVAPGNRGHFGQARKGKLLLVHTGATAGKLRTVT